MLDQAEEYFLYHAGGDRLRRELPELVTRPGLRVRVLLSLRDDALAKLDRFKGRIPNLFANYLRLDHLDRRSAARRDLEARRALQRARRASRSRSSRSWSRQCSTRRRPGKVDLGDAGRGLAAEESEHGSDRGAVSPARARADLGGGASGRIESPARSDPRSLGGAESIVRAHLHRAVEELTSEQRGRGGRRLPLPRDAVWHEDRPRGRRSCRVRLGRRAAPAAGALDARAGANRPDGRRRRRSNGARYEIFHDVLGEAVLAWRREQELERERREAERRHRRLFAVAIGALLALAAMTAVAIYAFTSGRNARTESRHAHARALLGEALKSSTSILS